MQLLYMNVVNRNVAIVNLVSVTLIVLLHIHRVLFAFFPQPIYINTHYTISFD